MKKLKLLSLFSGLLFFCISSSAWVATAPVEKSYSFKFKMNQETYQYNLRSSSYEDAFEKAAQSCYQHFKAGRQVSEERGLDIIDVCANPRST